MMKNKRDIKNILTLVLVSTLVIAFGIMLPFVLLRMKTSPSYLPNGEVNSDDVQPYGADTIQLEKYLLAASNSYTKLYDYTSNFGEAWLATKDNKFSEIGIQNQRSDKGYAREDEFLNALDDVITEEIGYSGLGSTIQIRSSEKANSDTHTIYYVTAMDNQTKVYIDAETGIPVYADIFVVSPYFANRENICDEITKLYRDYTGLDFVFVYKDISETDDFDSFYSYTIESSDHTVKLSMTIYSGWHWVTAADAPEEWVSTNNYEWHVEISLYS